MVGTADERTGLDVDEAEIERSFLEIAELGSSKRAWIVAADSDAEEDGCGKSIGDAADQCPSLAIEACITGKQIANALQAQGFACTNLANGTQANHQPDESVGAAELDRMLEVALALLAEAARC